jgi:hypothetical protein
MTQNVRRESADMMKFQKVMRVSPEQLHHRPVVVGSFDLGYYHLINKSSSPLAW